MQQIASQGRMHTHNINTTLSTRPHEADHQSGTYTNNNTTLPTRPHEADRQSGTHIQTTIQPFLQDRMKQIASQGHIYKQQYNPAYKTA